jgi:uncharacterized membrane protein YidH (DUF202 family)
VKIRDPGLQAERTALAWNRTALSLLANALLSLRIGFATESALVTLLAVALLVACGVLVAHGAWRRRVLLSVRPQIAPTHWAIGFTAVLAVATSAVGLASLFVSR